MFYFCRAETLPANDLPTLTLYTKDPCPLCDDLKEQLRPYLDMCKLELIYIDRSENVRWLRLYRNEIPVLFLNGEYLCKHKLNDNLLRTRLRNLKVS